MEKKLRYWDELEADNYDIEFENSFHPATLFFANLKVEHCECGNRLRADDYLFDNICGECR